MIVSCSFILVVSCSFMKVRRSFAPSLLLGNDRREQSVKFFIVELFDRGVEIAWQDMSP